MDKNYWINLLKTDVKMFNVERPEGYLNLSNANLSNSNLNNANLRDANLSNANLRDADLNNAKLDWKLKRKLVSNKTLMNKMFKKTSAGWVAYKTFNTQFKSPKKWTIKEGSIIKEKIDTNRWNDCSYGINVSTLEWQQNTVNIWEVLIPYTAEICVPIWTDGKVRVSECKLIRRKQIKESEEKNGNLS